MEPPSTVPYMQHVFVYVRLDVDWCCGALARVAAALGGRNGTPLHAPYRPRSAGRRGVVHANPWPASEWQPSPSRLTRVSLKDPGSTNVMGSWGTPACTMHVPSRTPGKSRGVSGGKWMRMVVGLVPLAVER
eukprot:scaffold70250_cov32-Tisochrysis_lutea.AAC.2